MTWWTRLGVVGKLIITIVLAVLATLIVVAISTPPKAEADSIFDPYMPIPALGWCPGGGVGSGWGGFCDGRRYADGTFWHSANAMGFWLPTQCVIDNGTAMPPAAPWGCVG